MSSHKNFSEKKVEISRYFYFSSRLSIRNNYLHPYVLFKF